MSIAKRLIEEELERNYMESEDIDEFETCEDEDDDIDEEDWIIRDLEDCAYEKALISWFDKK
jgi:hypothetical protein